MDISEITITTPTEATSLQESFAHLGLSRGSTDSIGQAVEYKRPSIASSSKRSSESTTTSIKRNLADASLSDNEEDQPDRKKMDDITEESHRSNSNSSTEDDQDMSRSGSGSGSAMRSASGSRDGRGSTPATSHSGHEPLKLNASHFNQPSSSLNSPNDPSPPAASSSNTGGQGRMAYVNPSPTTTSAYPFIPTTFGPGSTATFSLNPTMPDAFQASSGLVLNTSPDPPPYTIVTFGAGVKSKQLDAATAASPYGAFHVPTSAFPVGSGQFVLGGFGFIGRKHGLAMDNIVEAEMVLADGRIVWVGEGGRHGGEWKEDEDPREVWWGIRGAGPSLGVITRFRAKAFYLPSVYAGNLI